MRILAFGDSLTAGFGLPPGRSFADQLQSALQTEGLAVEIINAGISGDTTSGGLARIGSALRSSPDLVLLELGTNDGLMGVDPELVRNNLDRIIRACRDAGAGVILAGAQALGVWSGEYGRRFAAVFEDLASEHALPFYPDILSGVAGQMDLTLFDGIHPNEQGVARMVSAILPLVRETVSWLSGTSA
jgi:acyl-CoA thioesterase-1